MYAVSKDGVGIIAGTIAYSRRSAINCLMHNVVNPEPDSWERFKRTGYRTVMVQIKIVRPSPAVSLEQREYEPNVAPCDDAEFGMKP